MPTSILIHQIEPTSHLIPDLRCCGERYRPTACINTYKLVLIIDIDIPDLVDGDGSYHHVGSGVDCAVGKVDEDFYLTDDVFAEVGGGAADC